MEIADGSNIMSLWTFTDGNVCFMVFSPTPQKYLRLRVNVTHQSFLNFD